MVCLSAAGPRASLYYVNDRIGNLCGLLRAKGFPWISPVGHILVLVPSFDREFAMTFQGLTARSGAKLAPDLK